MIKKIREIFKPTDKNSLSVYDFTTIQIFKFNHSMKDFFPLSSYVKMSAVNLNMAMSYSKQLYHLDPISIDSSICDLIDTLSSDIDVYKFKITGCYNYEDIIDSNLIYESVQNPDTDLFYPPVSPSDELNFSFLSLN
jgi:hypothetical protein